MESKFLQTILMVCRPKDFPALIKLGEIVFITLYKGKTIKGKSICVIATKGSNYIIHQLWPVIVCC
jgi:hypothetical protein